MCRTFVAPSKDWHRSLNRERANWAFWLLDWISQEQPYDERNAACFNDRCSKVMQTP
jgi:hypothetical protein